MANHLEVPFSENGIERNATVQIAKNGITITIDPKPSVFIEGRYVEQFIAKWNTSRENS